ncbi:hypothetical protein Q5752_005400 [Cryptotrichosporon argae]
MPSKFRKRTRSFSAEPSRHAHQRARFDPDAFETVSEDAERCIDAEAEEDANDATLCGDEEQDEEEEAPQTLCVHAPYGNTLAAACYDPVTRKVFVLEDTKDTQAWDLAALLMEQEQPEKMVFSTKTPDAIIDMAQDYCTAHAETVFDLATYQTFSPGVATKIVACAKVARQPAGMAGPVQSADDDEGDAGMGKARLALVKLGCWINVAAPVAVGATGGLLAELDKQNRELGDGREVEYESIESMSLEEHMQINQDALTYVMPPAQSDKEVAVNLRRILDTCVTPLGRKLCHTWLLRPLLDLDQIRARHDAVELLSTRDNAETCRGIRRSLKSIKNVGQSCAKIAKGRANIREWQTLMDALHTAFAAKEKVASMSVGVEIAVMNKLRAALTDRLHEYLLRLGALIDFDASRDEGRVCVRPGIDLELDQWRADYARLEPMLEAIAGEIFRRIRPTHARWCLQINVVYIPQLGYQVAAHNVNGDMAPPASWEEQFSTPTATYYKTDEMHNLDKHYGDLTNDIADREHELIQDEADKLEEARDDVEAAVAAIAELDCLISFAEAVERYDLRRPVMRDDPLTKLSELFAQQFLDESLPITFCHMKTLLAEGTGQLTYLYKLTPEMSTTSNAAECALQHGMPAHVIERAREVTQVGVVVPRMADTSYHISHFEISKIIDADLTADDKEEIAQAEALARSFIDWRIDDEGTDIVEELRQMLGATEVGSTVNSDEMQGGTEQQDDLLYE